MLIWGSKGELADLGHVETKHCETCEKERSFKLMLQYKVSHIWYLFKWVSSKQYLLLCDICHRGAKLEAKSVEPTLAKNPIPFSSRYGWTFLVGFIALLVGFGMFASGQSSTRDAALISAPKAEDLYVVNIARFLKNPESSNMYGVMKVRSVNADSVELAIPGVSYSKVGGATKDASSRKTAAADYYGNTTISIPISELQTMRSSGQINSVFRN
jgi:hypothetical protein